MPNRGWGFFNPYFRGAVLKKYQGEIESPRPGKRRLILLVCVRVPEWFKDKVEQCIEIPGHLHFKRIYDPKSLEQTMHEMVRRGKRFQFICPVSSSYVDFQI